MPTTTTEGITGYWTAAPNAGRCSVCFTAVRSSEFEPVAKESGHILQLAFGYDVVRLCPACAIAMRELLTDALEDVEVERETTDAAE